MFRFKGPIYIESSLLSGLENVVVETLEWLFNCEGKLS